jgi:hypothetical protein
MVFTTLAWRPAAAGVFLMAWLLAAGPAVAAWCPYCLKSYGEPAPGDEGRVFALRTQHELECAERHRKRTTTSDSGTEAKGVVVLHNKTSRTIEYEIQTRSGHLAGWKSNTLSPGTWYYHWRSEPASFLVRWRSGGRARSTNLSHNVVYTSEPTADDGRPYSFVESGGSVELSPGVASSSGSRADADSSGARDAPRSVPLPSRRRSTPAARPRLSGFDARVLGSGSGQANGPFGTATSAQGEYRLYVRSPGTSNVVRRGRWTARRVAAGPAGGPYASETWEFTASGLGDATATMRGGAGTAHSWTVSLAGGDDIRVSFGVEFSGDLVRLLTFAKEF